MMTFEKDVLYPGSYWVSDGQGGKKKLVFTRQDVAALQTRMKEMLDAGLSIPLAAEHQDKAKPMTQEERKADWVKNLTMGWAEKAELAPEGFLTTKVAVPVEDDAKRLPASRFVSPEIVTDFVDGTGKLWPGPSITHLAVTPRPVNANQKPFAPVQMSNVVRLSLEEYESEKPEESKKPKAKEGAEEKPKESAPGKTKEQGGGLDLAGLRGVLAGDGYAVPDHVVDPGEFLKHLHTAALSKKAMIDKILQQAGADDNDDADGQEQKPGEGVSGSDQLPQGVSPENGPVLMSLTVGGRKVHVLAQANGEKLKKKEPVQMSHGNDRFEKALIAREKKDLEGRIKALFHSGRITKPIHDKLVQDMGTVRLSLDEEGSLASNSVVAKVEAYEALPAGSSWPTEGALPEGVTPAPEQTGWEGHESREQVQKTVDDFQSMLPGAAAAK